MNLSDQLKEFDLTSHQAEVYLALLELGSTNVVSIAKKTGMKRTTIYDILLELEKKRLITQTKKGAKRLFLAQNPESLRIHLEEKQSKLTRLLPALNALINTTGAKPIIRTYEGLEGIKDVYRDTLTYQGDLYAFVTENIISKLGQEFADEYRMRRRDAKVFAWVIGPDTPEIIAYQKTDGASFKETRLVPHATYPFTVEMNIYGHKIAFMSFKEQIGLIIESSEIAKNMIYLFQIAWNSVKK